MSRGIARALYNVRAPRRSYDSDERDFAEALWRILIDFNFMQYSVTVVTCRATSSKFKPPHLRRMQGVKGPHQNSTSLVVDFYVLQFKDPLVRPPEFRDARVLCFRIQSVARVSVMEPAKTAANTNGVYDPELRDLLISLKVSESQVRTLFLHPRKICIYKTFLGIFQFRRKAKLRSSSQWNFLFSIVLIR